MSLHTNILNSTQCMQLLEDSLTPVVTLWQGHRNVHIVSQFQPCAKVPSSLFGNISKHINFTTSDSGWRKLLKMKASQSRNKAHIGLSSRLSGVRQWKGSVGTEATACMNRDCPSWAWRNLVLLLTLTPQGKFYYKMKTDSYSFFNKSLFGGTFLPFFLWKEALLYILWLDEKQNQIQRWHGFLCSVNIRSSSWWATHSLTLDQCNRAMVYEAYASSPKVPSTGVLPAHITKVYTQIHWGIGTVVLFLGQVSLDSQSYRATCGEAVSRVPITMMERTWWEHLSTWVVWKQIHADWKLECKTISLSFSLPLVVLDHQLTLSLFFLSLSFPIFSQNLLWFLISFWQPLQHPSSGWLGVTGGRCVTKASLQKPGTEAGSELERQWTRIRAKGKTWAAEGCAEGRLTGWGSTWTGHSAKLSRPVENAFQGKGG